MNKKLGHFCWFHTIYMHRRIDIAYFSKIITPIVYLFNY